jgi:Arc/MetJ-type ribon-helix-helix transcriptional regulator
VGANDVRGAVAIQRGAIRNAPSSRMTSPFSILFSTIWQASCAYSAGEPRRRLSDEDLRQLDNLVHEGGFRTRAEAVRAGIRTLSRVARDEQIAAAYARAYGKMPLTDEEQQMLDAATALSLESLQ